MNDILLVLSLVTAVGFMLRSCWATTKGNKALCCAAAFIALSLGESIREEHSIIPWVVLLIIVLVHGVHKALTMPDYPDTGRKSIAGIMIVTLLVAFSAYNFDKHLADAIMLCGLFIYMVSLATRDAVLNMRKARIPIK